MLYGNVVPSVDLKVRALMPCVYLEVAHPMVKSTRNKKYLRLLLRHLADRNDKVLSFMFYVNRDSQSSWE